MLPGRSLGCLISTCIYPLNLPKLHSPPPPCPSLTPPPNPWTPPSTVCRGDETWWVTCSICSPPLVSPPPGFNIHCSTSQWVAQFSVLFFLFLLILFKFDAALVLVWYTLYKIYEYEHQFVSPGNLLKYIMTHTHTHQFLSIWFRFS